MHKRVIWAILILAAVLASAHPLRGEEDIEDLINIEEVNRKGIAIRQGRRSVSFNLRSKENIIWSGSKGYLGALLTKERFLVISTSSTAWHELSLRTEEAADRTVLLSANLAILVTRERAIAFDRIANRFIESRLPIHDQFIAAEAEKYFVVVLTSSRALGLTLGTKTFIDARLRTGETLESLTTNAWVATIRTSERLLKFQASDSSWHELGY